VRVLAGHVGSATSVAFSPDGERVVTGGEDGTVRLWRCRVGSLIRTIRAHTKPVAAAQFSHDCEHLFSAGADRALKVWRVSDGKFLGKFGALVRSHRRGITSLSLSPDGFRIVTGGADNAVKLWDIESRRKVRTHPKCHKSKVLAACYSRDGTLVATGGDSGEVRLIDHRPAAWVERDGPLPRLDPLPGLGQTHGIAFSPDGSLLAAAGQVLPAEEGGQAAQRAFGVWRLGEGKLWKSFPGTNGSAVSFSPGGHYLAAADAYDASQVLRLEDGLVVASYASARGIAFSPDGQLVAVADDDGLVRLHSFNSPD
jgi:WD40 repeat protein